MKLIDDIKKIKEKYHDYSVLYVEDEEKVRVQTLYFLTKFFSNIDTAVDGQDGLSMFDKNSYDIVISDLQMPKLDGKEMLKKIREKNDKVMLIALSAYDSSADVTGITCDYYLSKPVVIEDFIKVFNSL